MSFELFKTRYFSAGAHTDPGLVRADNQDAYRNCPGSGLFVVSDGMGGGDGGGKASAIVARCLGRAAQSPLKDMSAIVRFSYQANSEIVDFASRHNMRGMGATLVGLLLSPFDPGSGVVFSAGDSRAYRWRGGAPALLTTDHTIASAMGVSEEKLARNLQGVLTNVAGCGTGFFVESKPIDICSGDRYLLCSDGVYRQLSEREMTDIVCGNTTDVSAKARQLVEATLKHGGVDNATAIVLEFGTLPEISDAVRREESECPECPLEEDGDDVTPPTE